MKYKIVVLINLCILFIGCAQSNTSETRLSERHIIEREVTKDLRTAYSELSEVKSQMGFFDMRANEIGLDYRTYVTCMIYHKYIYLGELETHWKQKLETAGMSFNKLSLYRLNEEKKNLQDLISRLSQNEILVCTSIKKEHRFFNHEMVGIGVNLQ